MYTRWNVLLLVEAVWVISGVKSVCPPTGTYVLYKPDYTDCNRYYICAFGLSHRMSCGNGTVWQQERKVCTLKGSLLDTCTGTGGGVVLETTLNPEVPRYGSEVCNSGTVQKFAHATNCARFYDCSQPTRLLELSEPYERECPYPQVFNEIMGACDMHTNVKCQGKYLPTNPCDYAMNHCLRSHCPPCNIRFPDCKGLDNGYQVWKGRERSPYYAVCDNGRVIGNGTCPEWKETQYLFHPVWKGCVEPRLMP